MFLFFLKTGDLLIGILFVRISVKKKFNENKKNTNIAPPGCFVEWK